MTGLSLVSPPTPYVTSPNYVVHVDKGNGRTLCGHRIERHWIKGRVLPKRECTPCRRMQ